MKQSHKNVLKWVLYLLLLLVFYTLQTTPGLFQIMGVKPVLIVPFALCVSMFEGELGGAVIGILTGLLWDVSSGRLLGYNGLMMMAFCIVVALLVMYLMRANWLNTVLLCGAVMLVQGLLDFVFYYVMWGYSGVSAILVQVILPTALYTVLISPLMFLLVRKMAMTFNEVVRV